MALNKKLISSLLITSSLCAISSNSYGTNCANPLITSINSNCQLEENDVFVVAEGVKIDAGTEFGVSANGVTIGDVTNNGQIDAAEGGIIIENDSVVTNIINNGIINATNEDGLGLNSGIEINDSLVSGSIINNGKITAEVQRAILVTNGSTVNNNIINNSNLVTIKDDIDTIEVTGNSIVLGKVINNGKITSSEAGISVKNNSDVKGGLYNEGTITSLKDDGVDLGNSSLSGGIVNNGLIIALSSSGDGFDLDDDSEIEGQVQNNGTIRVDDNGFEISENTKLNGGILNSGEIISNDTGIFLEEGAKIYKGILNTGSINSDIGIYVEEGNVFGGIKNEGIINGKSYAIRIDDVTQAVTIDNSGTLIGNLIINDSILNLNSGSILSGMGTIEGANGTVNINTSYSTTSNYNVKTINLSESNSLTITGNNSFTVTDKFYNQGGSLYIDRGNTLTVEGNYEQTSNSELKIGVKSKDIYGKIVINGEGNFDDSAKLFVDASAGIELTNKHVFEEVIKASSLITDGFLINDNSILYNYSAIVQDDNTVDLVVDVNSLKQLSTTRKLNSSLISISNSIDEIVANGANEGSRAIIDYFSGISSDDALAKSLEGLLPVNTQNVSTATLRTTSNISKIVQARNILNKGISYGSIENSQNNVWIKPFGSWSSLDNKGDTIGYDADSYGLVFGADKIFSDELRLGVSLAFSETQIDSNDSSSSADVSSYNTTIYGSYDIGDSQEISFQLGGGYHKNEGNRKFDAGTANSQYDSWSVDTNVSYNKVINVNKNAQLITSIGLDYSYIKIEDFTETGNSGFNLNVEGTEAEQLIPSFDFKLRHGIADGLKFDIAAGLGYDLLNDDEIIISSFVGGGSAFQTQVAKTSSIIYNSGIGLLYDVDNDLSVSLNYDREDRGSDFQNQSVSLKAKFTF